MELKVSFPPMIGEVRVGAIEKTMSSRRRQMIPYRMLSSEIYGKGLKGRAIACRKRLRVNRMAQRAQINNDAEGLFAKTTPTVSDFQNYAADYSVNSAVGRMDYRSPLAAAEHGENEMLVLIGEQEVGIT